MAELKPCPFCGSKAVSAIDFVQYKYGVYCINCDACGPMAKTKQRAIDAWNKRSQYEL